MVAPFYNMPGDSDLPALVGEIIDFTVIKNKRLYLLYSDFIAVFDVT
jgi:hypothetical protein